ncbi:Lrp/AsnC ligand binding domain-containing protein [Aureisphaera galaxeae]|uniref:Lrp/AsnC family transcriptional regulator n=1 Tax=Aureisphaera galaxeae TaxID=1538023 RepID=UPI00234FDDBF|nr:Lrp/AsnC ligand binding domain-containing protein [Aureisphaera galaxeae]MDC8004190.1 Lrp/AsnC ligand binding domain-containing protein [Aureisphaera galaxeae]
MSQIDYVDYKILTALKKDARKAYSKIAEELQISNSLVHQRIKKMKDNGLILRSDLVLDEKKLGYSTKSYVGIRLKQARFADEVIVELEKIPEVKECNYVSGKYAIFVLIHAKDNDALRAILYEQIHEIQGVEGTESFICFTTNFNRSVPVIFEKPAF